MVRLLVIVLALTAFVAAIVVPLKMSGNLSKEAIQKVIDKKRNKTVASAPKEDPATPLLRALKQQREALEKREEKVKEDEERTKLMQADLEQLRTELKAIQADIQAKLSQEDTDRQKRLADVAAAISKMKPLNAAETLKTFTPDEAGGVLQLVKERERTKILDAMDQELAANILKTMQAPRI